MIKNVICPICGNAGSGRCEEHQTTGDFAPLDCTNCGRYNISGTALREMSSIFLTNMQKSAISHFLRTASSNTKPPMITPDWLSRFKESGKLPNPATQVLNLIRAIGDHVSQHGTGFFMSPSTASIIGAFDFRSSERLLEQLIDKNLVIKIGQDTRPSPIGGVLAGYVYDLTLDGWSRYEAERRGEVSVNRGFLAMKFGIPSHDKFADLVIKPTVRDGIGFDLVDLRDVSRAGIINNIMRTQIRDSAFVIADLTHDNHGAYWEAGYAEGLGKPVIYICERTKFDTAKTHFDTNHCTTVLWSETDDELFGKELVATLRRSLNLFQD